MLSRWQRRTHKEVEEKPEPGCREHTRKGKVTLAELQQKTPSRRRNLNKCNQMSFVRYSLRIQTGAESEKPN